MRGLTIAALPVVIACGTANAQAWQKIDCGNSRITVPGQVSCWEGPPAQWTARAGPGFSIKFQCVANDGSAYTKAGGMRGFVRYHMQQPGSNAHCFRNEGSNGPLSLIQQMNHVTKMATGWTGPNQDGDRYFATFRSQDGDICSAFIAHGALMSGGYTVNRPSFGSATFEYRVTGYICGANGAALSDTDMQAYIASVRIRTQ